MKSILFCDSEPAILPELKCKLLELGFDQIIECTSATRAVETILEDLPDIAVLSADTPGMTGLEAAAIIRQQLRIPIILLASNYDASTTKQAAKSGIAALLVKPLREENLLAAIEMALAHSLEMEELKEKIVDLQEIIDNRKIIEKAKGILMQSKRLGEAEAYRFMQKSAMDTRSTLRQIADSIIRKAR